MLGYATRTGTRRNLDALRAAGWRLLVTAGGCLRNEGFSYALDNGAWGAHQRGESIDLVAFDRALVKMGSGADWVVAPDIVCGGYKSLDLSVDWLPGCLARCRRVLIAVQDGMTPADINPYLCDRVGIFVGGSTEWKLETLPMWGDLCRNNKAWFHVGRVNSAKRIRLCGLAGAWSFDGTSASRFALSLPRLEAARFAASLSKNPYIFGVKESLCLG